MQSISKNESTAYTKGAGKVWLITGAGRGIGAEIARAALAACDQVVAKGRNAEQTQAAYASHGNQVLCLALDVSRELEAVAAVETAAACFGRIDALVNNAGYGQLGLFEEVASADVERQFATNVFGLMHVTRAALPLMRRQRSGQPPLHFLAGTDAVKHATETFARRRAEVDSHAALSVTTDIGR